MLGTYEAAAEGVCAVAWAEGAGGDCCAAGGGEGCAGEVCGGRADCWDTVAYIQWQPIMPSFVPCSASFSSLIFNLLMGRSKMRAAMTNGISPLPPRVRELTKIVHICSSRFAFFNYHW